VIPAVVGIPIKPFGVAKARLAPTLDGRARSRLGRAVARHTAGRVTATGVRPFIVTGDAAVRAWAEDNALGVIGEPVPGGLDAAATAVIAAAGDDPWAVVHADLPLLTVADLEAVWRALDDGAVICPSRDGGTSLVAGVGNCRFSYGPGSFHRHLSAMPSASVVVRRGLALDLDTAADLAVARVLPPGAWLDEIIAGAEVAQ